MATNYVGLGKSLCASSRSPLAVFSSLLTGCLKLGVQSRRLLPITTLLLKMVGLFLGDPLMHKDTTPWAALWGPFDPRQVIQAMQRGPKHIAALGMLADLGLPTSAACAAARLDAKSFDQDGKIHQLLESRLFAPRCSQVLLLDFRLNVSVGEILH